MNLFYFTKQAPARLFAAIALFSLVAGMLPTQAFAANVFTGSFEAASFAADGWTSADSGWSITPGSGHTGSKKAQIVDSSSNDRVLRKAVSTVGQSNIVLSYYYKTNQPLESSDHVYVEWYNGYTWSQLADHKSIANGSWTLASWNLPAGANNLASFAFRFRENGFEEQTHHNNDKDEFWLDTFSVTGTPIPPPSVLGCTDPAAINYNAAATPGNANATNCTYPPAPVLGCIDPSADNYNAAATPGNVNAADCDYTVLGCMDGDASNYNPLATEDDDSCEYPIEGCTNPAADNYDADAEVDDGSCEFTPVVEGCTNADALNYNPLATQDNGSCIAKVFGCMDDDANNYSAGANVDNGSCTYDVLGCTDDDATNYNPLATVSNNSCVYPPVLGCTDPAAINYNAAATPGNANATNCTYPPASVLGCTNPQATNYNPLATQDNGSCDFGDPDPEICENPNAQNFGEEGTCVVYTSQCLTAPANLLVNGSFEDPGLLSDNSWSNLDNVTGWTYDLLAGLEVWRGFSGFLASNGLHNIELDGDAPTAISQTVATIPGATYELSFDFAARSGTPEANNAVLATADTSTVVNTSTDNTNWVKYGATFQADASTDIVLSDIGSPADTYGTLIDNTVLCLVREPAPVDYCPNIQGNQTEQSGYTKDVNGQCYTPITSCSVNVVSDTSNTVNDSGALLVTPNGGWVASIAGSLAQWIWGTSTALPISGVVDEVQTFEKTFVWSGTPSTATLKISSDNGYSVKLNGTVVASDAGEFNYQSVDTIVSLTDDLIQGVNTLEISVTNIANGQTAWVNNPAALLYDLTITDVTGECGPDDGGGDNDVDTYRIEGFVWHDDNQNEDWDNNPNDEEVDEEGSEPEDSLAGWTVRITNGEGDNRSTTTDEFGFYYFEVPAGTWTITEDVKDGWERTTQESYVVEVPGDEMTLLDSVVNFIIPTAFAAVIGLPYGDYNFGNDQTPSRSGGGGNGGNSGGTLIRDGRVLGDSDTVEPTPLVLGEQVSAVPTGAPDAGAGGAAPKNVELFTVSSLAILSRARKHG